MALVFFSRALRFSIAHGVLQQGLDALQVGLGMGQRRLLVGLAGDVGPRIDLGEELVFLHPVVEIDEDLLDRPGDERADLHAQHRLHRAGGIDGQDALRRDAPGGCGTGW